MAYSNKSRHERGYGSAWDRLRKVILRRDCGLCQCDECKRLGRLLAASHVDHIKRKVDGGTDDPSNLRAVNAECHKRITAEQAGRKYHGKHAVGLDGWPMGV